ncbi:hypothetical protein MMC26_000633 [Xylographa opegraphella]|nr:hypothetical protein [Xylographa opegraphella]
MPLFVHNYSSAIFLEALQVGVKIIGSLFNSNSQGHDSKNDGILIWPSDGTSRSRVQLRSGDAFLVDNVDFSLELCQKASEREPTNIIDLGSETGLDHGDPADGRLSPGTSVDPERTLATVTNEPIKNIQDGRFHAMTEDVLPIADDSKSKLGNDTSPQNNEFKPLSHDSQSSTLEKHHNESSIFGHIRHDSIHRDSIRRGSDSADSTSVQATTRAKGNDDDHQHDLVHHVPAVPKSRSPLFKDIVREEVENDTQDSTSRRVDDLLERAGLQNDTASGPTGRWGDEDTEESEITIVVHPRPIQKSRILMEIPNQMS